MFKITMPQAGNSMEDGTIVRWLKNEGQAVQKGETLLEVETDKAMIEVESNAAGTVRKILYPAASTVLVHTVIAILGAPGEDVTQAVGEAEKENAALAAKAQAGQSAPAAEAPPAAAPGAAPAKAGGAVIPILMPQVGNSMEEGTVVKWHVKPGDRIKQGDIIFDVETDKATIEVEATDAGRLARIVVQEDETIEVKKPVAFLADNDADVDAYLAAGGVAPPAVQSPAAAPGSVPAAPAAVAASVPTASVVGRVKASPAARRIAAERGVDLSGLGGGSGPGGRILSTDVAVAPGAAAKPAFVPAPPPKIIAGQAVRRRMSGMRKAVARNLLASKQNIPHFYIQITIDAEPMMAFYRGQKAKYACTVNDVIVMACARAIAEFPAFRSRIDTEKNEIVEFPTANIGIAVGLDDGLVVPVVVAAEQMTLQQIGGETKRLIEAARGGKIENMGQGVFTITNLGMFGIEQFSAIINPPEAAILAVGAVREAVIVREGAMRPGEVLTLSVSADHRVVDGLLAAKYLNRLKEILESPAQLA